jgi:cytochrome c biogenesis protein CcmG/thiol:disulfide interchange protein DsbE
MQPVTVETNRRALWALLPLTVFAGLAGLFWKGLSSDPSHLPSTLIGKPVPEFVLQPVDGIDRPGFSNGKVSIVNIFASWCVPCRDEHPLLMELARRQDIQLLGIDTKDKPADAKKFLDEFGYPYARIGSDFNGRVSIDWGGYGVPETFVVDPKGNIRFKLVGPITPEQLSGPLADAIQAAKKP